MLVLVLVLGGAQPDATAAGIGSMFDHPRRTTQDKRAVAAARHLEDASTSIALNIAEGNGKRSSADRIRYLEIARGSSLECAACLDVLVVRRRVSSSLAAAGKATLVRVVSILTRLIGSLNERPSTSTSTSTSTIRKR